MPTLPTDFLPRLIRLLSPKLRSDASRDALVAEAYHVAAPNLLDQIDTNGSPRDVAAHMIEKALEFGCLENGQHALIPLLEALRTRYGVQEHEEIDELSEAVQPLCENTARAFELRYLLKLLAQIGTTDADRRAIKRALLVGEPDATEKAIKSIARRLASTAMTDANAPLPVLIRLATWTDQRSTLKSLIRGELAVSDTRMDRLLRRNRVALLLLELDALPNVARIQTIRDFLADHPAISVVITARNTQQSEALDLEPRIVRA